jgi:hypothetical protein
VGVQVRVAGPAVPVGERSRNEAADVDLPDPLWPGPGEQDMLLDEPQRVLHSGLMGPFDHSRHRRIGDRPQTRHRLHRREGQVIPGNCLGPRPGVFRDLPRQLPSVNRLTAMLGLEELAGHFGPHPRPIRCRQRCVGRQAGCGIDSRDAFRDLEPERADDTINDPERSSKTGRVLKVPQGEVGSFQLLLPQLGQGMQTAAEQRSHLLSGHRVADRQAVDPIQARTGPHTPGVSPRSV